MQEQRLITNDIEVINTVFKTISKSYDKEVFRLFMVNITTFNPLTIHANEVTANILNILMEPGVNNNYINMGIMSSIMATLRTTYTHGSNMLAYIIEHMTEYNLCCSNITSHSSNGVASKLFLGSRDAHDGIYHILLVIQYLTVYNTNIKL